MSPTRLVAAGDCNAGRVDFTADDGGNVKNARAARQLRGGRVRIHVSKEEARR